MDAYIYVYVSTAFELFMSICCRSAPICIGDQSLDIKTNSCYSPNCKRYSFQRLDSATQTCVYRPGKQIYGTVLLIHHHFSSA